MFLSIIQHDQTPQELVTELVRECSIDEQLRLLAFFNAERYEGHDAKRLKRISGGGLDPTKRNEKPVLTSAVAAWRL
jgi:hypothetical protein